MGFMDIFSNTQNDILEQNEELLEDYDLITTFGSPNKLFLKFLNSKNLKINEDIITEELIEEFQDSVDSINLKMEKIKRQKEIIFNERKVWINIPSGDEWIGTDLLLDHDGITVQKTKEKVLYSQMDEIEICDGGWSKKKFQIICDDRDLVFAINENLAVPLKEILEDNIENESYDELDGLLELYSLFEEGKISQEEFEIRKAVIYSDDVYCTNCGEKLDSDSLFCPECGQQVLFD
jgi:L-cysteine desulfidase